MVCPALMWMESMTLPLVEMMGVLRGITSSFMATRSVWAAAGKRRRANRKKNYKKGS